MGINTKDCNKAVYILKDNVGISNFRVIDNSIIRIYESKTPQSDIIKTLVLNDISIGALTKKIVPYMIILLVCLSEVALILILA
jgi:ABC-2 type transport system ATP-binding protein